MFLIFGHRGSPLKHRENTVASFEEALAAGADGFETDLRLLADEAAVLFHDDEFGGRVVETMNAAELKADALDVLQRFAGRCTMVLEVKRSRWEERVIDEVGKWPNIVVASFDHRAIAEMSRRKCAFALGLTIFGAIVDVAAYANKLGATWLFPNYRFTDEELVASAHAAQMMVVPWTPNRRADWQRLSDIGCDGIITDLPDEAVQWRAEAATLRASIQQPREGGGQ